MTEHPAMPVPAVRLRPLSGLCLWALLLLCLAGCASHSLAAPPSPVPPVPTFTPVPTPSPTFTPTPSLTVSGDYEDPVEHAAGRYALRLTGSRVAASFFTSRSPMPYRTREVAAPLFTVPEEFRPPYSVLRSAVGIPVRVDGTPDPDHPEPRRFLLRVDPDGTVRYADEDPVGRGFSMGAEEYLAYALHTIWGTTPAANDRAVLEILDRHWFGETLLSAEPPPAQFEAPAHVWGSGTHAVPYPAARVGAFVMFDADGRVTALGAPTNEFKVEAGAPVHRFNGPLLAELGQLHRLERLDLEYRELSSLYRRITREMTYSAFLARDGSLPTRPGSLTGAIPPQLGQLTRLRHLDLSGHLLIGTLPSELGRLASLEYLDLGDNWLTWLPPELGQLPNLQHARPEPQPVQVPAAGAEPGPPADAPPARQRTDRAALRTGPTPQPAASRPVRQRTGGAALRTGPTPQPAAS